MFRKQDTKVIGILMLSTLQAQAFQECDKYEKNVKAAQELCTAGEQVSAVCNSILQFGGPLALACGIPGLAAQMACDLRDSFKKMFNDCLDHEQKVAPLRAQKAIHDQMLSDQNRPRINEAIREYNEVINPTFDRLAWNIELILQGGYAREESDELIYSNIQDQIKWWDDNRPFMIAKGDQKFEDFFWLFRNIINKLGYTEWDNYAATCFSWLPNLPTAYYGVRCIKPACESRNKQMQALSLNYGVCRDDEL